MDLRINNRNEIFSISIHEKSSIGSLKDLISQKIGLKPSEQVLYYQTQPLVNYKQLVEYQIQDGGMIYLEKSLLGGSDKFKCTLNDFWRCLCCCNPNLVRNLNDIDREKAEKSQKENI